MGNNIRIVGENTENKGSIVQLMESGDGIFDKYFIDDSESFLNIEYKKHSNFSTGFVTWEFYKQIQEVETYYCSVPAWGDLVDLHLIVESNYKLTNQLLLKLFKRIALYSDPNCKFMEVDSFSYHTFLTVKGENISENKCYNEESKIVYKYSLKLPFNINGRLPILALQFTPIYLACHLNKFKDNELHELMNVDENEKDGDILPPFSVKTKLGCSFIFLDTLERRGVACTDYELLLDNNYTICTHKKCSDSNTLNIELTLSELSPTPHKYIVFYVHSGDYFDPNEFNMDPIINATLFFNGEQKEKTDSNYMRLYDPKRKMGKELPLGMYMISFALHPDKIEPSGSANLFKMEQITLNIKFPDIPSPNYNVTVCGCSTNIFKTKNGIGLPIKPIKQI